MIKLKKDKKSSKKELKGILKKFKENTKNPEIFLSVQSEKSEALQQLLKSLYDYGKKAEDEKDISSALPELILDEMDEEQVWQQLELQNEEILAQKIATTSTLLSLRETKMQLDYKVPGDEEEMPEEVDEDEEMAAEEEIEEKPKKKSKKKAKTSDTEDRFFNLDEMDQFLDAEDKKEMQKMDGKAEKNPLVEIDYFNGDFSDGDDSEDEEETGKNLKYSNFFDDEDEEAGEEEEEDYDENAEEGDEADDNEEAGGDEEDETEEAGHEEEFVEAGSENKEAGDGKQIIDGEEGDDVEANRRLRFHMWNYQHGIVPDAKQLEELKPVVVDDLPKSSFEIRQDKLQQRIVRMEEQILKEKPWQLKGEISAATRPQNSLLEEVLEFDSTTRPAPVVTEETTMRLEDIIKQRIKDKAFDDVERKIKPPDNPREYRKQLVLDSEKSKLSLAQIYEKDYLKQLEKTNPDADEKEEEEPVEHKEIRNLMKALLTKLDALANYHFTPRPAVADIKIITNTPAINMEEVAPIATSDVTLLAPEEIMRRPKGDVMSKEERTRTDKNRERRLKKRFQHDKEQRELKKEKAREEKGIVLKDKESMKKLMGKVIKSRNVDKMVENNSEKAVKSSKAFFSQLQDVTAQSKSKTKNSAKDKDKKSIQATQIKL